MTTRLQYAKMAGMETTAARYDRLAGAFAEKIDAVPRDAWDNPSPCEDWTALDVVKHVTETPGMFLGFVGRELPETPPVEDNPAAAFASTRQQIQSALEDPAVAEAEFEGFMGKQTFAQAIDRFICFDLLVHGWDLSRAAGLDEAMDPADVVRLAEASKQFGDAMRGPQAFGEAVEPPADATPQDHLLAFLGRHV